MKNIKIIILLFNLSITNFIRVRVVLFEPRREKNRLFTYAKTKTQISFAVTTKLISAFVFFATQIVQSLYLLNPKFQASRHLLWLYSPVCVGLGQNLVDRFSHNEAHFFYLNTAIPYCCHCYNNTLL